MLGPIGLPEPGPQCGNHIVETGERCDDGNSNDSDGCTSDCRLSLFHYLKASNPGRLDSFGQAIALSAEASAAPGIGGDQADNTAGASGAVYVFARSGASWSQQAYIKASKASNTDALDRFGGSVTLSPAIGEVMRDQRAASWPVRAAPSYGTTVMVRATTLDS